MPIAKQLKNYKKNEENRIIRKGECIMGKVKISKEEYKDLIFLDDIPWLGLPHNVRAAHLLHLAHMGGHGSPLCNTTSLNEQVIIREDITITKSNSIK